MKRKTNTFEILRLVGIDNRLSTIRFDSVRVAGIDYQYRNTYFINYIRHIDIILGIKSITNKTLPH